MEYIFLLVISGFILCAFFLAIASFQFLTETLESQHWKIGNVKSNRMCR